MASTLKTVPRSVADELETPLVGRGLPLQEEVAVEAEESATSLEEAIELAANRSLLMLESETIGQKRERVEKMFDRIAACTAQLSPELCKEDHGKFMALSAQIEQLCLCIQARLVSLEHDVSAQDIQDVPWVVWLLSFTDRARKLIRGRELLIRKRDADTATIRSWRELVRTERERPARIHEEAVQHVKRLLLYDHQQYRQIQAEIQETSAAVLAEENKNYHSKRWEALRAAAQALQAQVPLLEKECYDRALQKVQESDNGPRQK